MSFREVDRQHMQRALELARRGQGLVEPNPMVGCVVAKDDRVLGEGWHRAFGEAHAEVNALEKAGGCAGATAYVTLEPCCHQGQTPPCTTALIEANISAVVIASRDPFPQVDGGGVARLEADGITVREGLLNDEARHLNAPYFRLVEDGRPWIHAKWAMTLDGKLATNTGHSQWISGETSRQKVHELRGRVDAIIVGRQTAVADDPLLTARPPGPRVARRIVMDSTAQLPLDSQLVTTAHEIPTVIVTGPDVQNAKCVELKQAGCQVWNFPDRDANHRLRQLFDKLGEERCTHVLVEGGSELLGSLFDARLVDEVHAFIASKLVGGAGALSPLAGAGLPNMDAAIGLDGPSIEVLGTDVYVQGRIGEPSTARRS